MVTPIYCISKLRPHLQKLLLNQCHKTVQVSLSTLEEQCSIKLTVKKNLSQSHNFQQQLMFVLGFSHLSKYWTFKKHLSAKKCKTESKLRLRRAGTSTQHSVVLSTESNLGPDLAFTWHRAWANMSCISAQFVSSGSAPDWQGYRAPGSEAVSTLYLMCYISRRETPTAQMLLLPLTCFWKSCLFCLFTCTIHALKVLKAISL